MFLLAESCGPHCWYNWRSLMHAAGQQLKAIVAHSVVRLLRAESSTHFDNEKRPENR